MSSDQADAISSNTKPAPVKVTDWNELVRYTQFLCRGTDNKIKICMIDEEQEEIRIENKDEFDTNVKYARDHGLKSLILTVYFDDVHKFDGIYYIEKMNGEIILPKIITFPSDKLQNLRNNVLADKWYIPVKIDEPFGICLTSAIKIAQEGKLDTNVECKQFIETIVPEAFRKLQTTQSVFSWPREIQYGIFDMLELLVDLVGTRLRSPPVPITLLNTLALSFDTNTTFAQKHKDEQLPTGRVYKLDGEEFLRFNTNNKTTESYGWLRSIIQRFIAQNGLKSVRSQFEYINNFNSPTTAMEYNCLLKLFSKCHQCIDAHHFRLIFTGPIRQAIQYFLQTKKSNNGANEQLNELNETLLEVCFNYEMNDEVNELLELPSVPKDDIVEISTVPVTIPLQKLTINKKTKTQDCYERLAENIRSLTMNNGDTERKNIKKQRTDEQQAMSSFNRTDDLLSSSEKRSLKRKHRREQQRSAGSHNNNNNKKENKKSNAVAPKTYDRSDPADILRFFAPMKAKIATLYDNLQTATCHGNLREVLKIEEKLKLLRPYSARFIADENTPDGTPMQLGQVFRKGWILLNDGSMPWSSDDIKLVNLTDGIKVVQQPIVPVTAPHDRAVITIDYTCADEPGTYESKWILSFRHQTFGPMIWCSIEVGHTAAKKPAIELKEETFEFVNIPLPACFDLSKPYQSEMSTSTNNSLRSSFMLPRSNSIETQSEPLIDIDNLQSPYFSDSDSLSAFMYSPPPMLTNTDETLVNNSTPLIRLTPALQNNHVERQQSIRSNQSLDFVDTVVTNIFSVAKQAGSTAKAIFNTLQATDETTTPIVPPVQEPQTLFNTAITNETHTDDFFEHVDEHTISSNDPMDLLIEMGFANRSKNQQLLAENHNDLNKVIELLTNDNNDDTTWFAHRH